MMLHPSNSLWIKKIIRIQHPLQRNSYQLAGFAITDSKDIDACRRMLSDNTHMIDSYLPDRRAQ
jgi:hypothetical protein